MQVKSLLTLANDDFFRNRSLFFSRILPISPLFSNQTVNGIACQRALMLEVTVGDVLTFGMCFQPAFATAQKLLDFITVLERQLGRTARKELLPLQPGDVPESFADIEASRRDLGFEPKTTIEVGLERFVHWYKWYHKVN